MSRMLSSALVLVLCLFSNHIVEAQSCPSIPDLSSFTSTALPDPFTFADGTPVTDLASWECRRAEISTLLQVNELGILPPKPSTFSASFSATNNSLIITCGNSGKSITFTPTITFPSSGEAPFPAIIGLDGGSIPHPPGVAIINFNTADMAQQNSATSRGIGKFYNLFGSDASAGAMIAWAWAISRIIDALEITPSAQIDTTRLGVTGCSRDGKGALVAGAFEPRIALTISQESGSGGTDCWRLSDFLFANGLVTQTASEIVQENVWFSPSFDSFANSSVNKLPVDHHMLAGLVAPRGLFAIDNIGFDWLGPWSSWGCIKSAQRIYQALGVSDSIGVSQAANHTHCAFPASQQSELNAFVNRFLLGQEANTSVVETAGNSTFDTPGVWDPWSAPTLTS